MGRNVNYNSFFSKVFLWMFVGLLITFGTAYFLSTFALNCFIQLISNPIALILIVLIQLGLVFVISLLFNKLPTPLLGFLFILYSFFTGITFSAIFLVFELGSIIFIFGLTAFLFALLAIIGFTTKTDLTKLGVILFVALVGIIISSIINIFLQNSVLDMIISAIAIIVFLGLVAFDIQKLKKMCESDYNEESKNKIAIRGALSLYLDFINLFINLLQLFGERK
ncbi:MAG: Bax inhibitor-1/YccA family protein [Candidatus Diapherotrites archaeon]|uniref:Bax inhibitor-1/YccA family protein n=1 Tax=Candidatus Iainarchaeum sp. TaxID=3101447 RepID=A0A7K4BZ98_9ARCH|nr:Bax inhibitor-1/YccA family protein [Candidatus Diapherotrites archaeon]